MPMAIDRATWIAGRRRKDRKVLFESLDFDERSEFELSANELKPVGDDWTQYLRGVASIFEREFSHPVGWEGVSVSDVPIASGLSSSASFTIAIAGAFVAAGGFEWNPRKLALLAHRVENEWIGVNCGIMDQLAS